jgi:hypothetical protein
VLGLRRQLLHYLQQLVLPISVAAVILAHRVVSVLKMSCSIHGM